MRTAPRQFGRSARRPPPRRGSPRRRAGQVLIITLICLTLLAGLIFYVYNLGTEVNRRMALQHASDSAVISGATWMARAMNTVAMNNCESARLLAMVPIFDSLPLASGMALGEVDAWETRLSDQLSRSVPEAAASYTLLMGGLTTLRDRMARQKDILAGLDSAFNGGSFDMRSTTWWQPPGASAFAHGAFWEAVLALDAYSRATVESAGVFAQEQAVRYGLLNRANVAFLVPVLPVLPAARAGFREFQPPIQGRQRVTGSGATMAYSEGSGGRGGMGRVRGGAIPDMEYPHRLGPWARLWRWRDYFMTATDWEWMPPVAGGPGRTRGSTGNVNLGGRRTGSSARGGGNNSGVAGWWRATAWELTGYYTYGPYNWAMRRVNWHALGNWQDPGDLRDAFFHEYMNRLSRIKLTYMFGSQAPQTIHEPNWIVDYNRATQIAQTQRNTISRTMFYVVEVASSVPESSTMFLSPGTYRTNGPNPIAIWARGWVNTEDPNRWPIPKIGNYVWKDTYSYETTQDPQLGIHLRRDAAGHPIWQPVYMVAWYVWGGIDIGGNTVVENPCNWDSGANLPAPWLLDTSAGDYDPGHLDPDAGARRAEFSYLGVARHSSGAPAWPARFRRALPDAVTAVAQAKVFNHSSWDLWTQDWQAQLTPVSQWQDWMDQMSGGAADAPGGVLTSQDVRDAWDYLRKLQDLADAWLNH